MSQPTVTVNYVLCIMSKWVISSNSYKSCVTGSYRLEASYAVWEDHLYISLPHVPNPPFIGAPAVVVRDNIVLLSTSTVNTPFSKVFESCISFGEDCMPVDLRAYIISTMVLVTNSEKPSSKTVHGSPIILKCFTTCHFRKSWNWTPPRNKEVEFLLRKSVSQCSGVIHHFSNAPGNNKQKNPFQNPFQFSHNFKMIE